ncbi:MAG: EamA family transporter [Thermodesulfobacteriota bacterium]
MISSWKGYVCVIIAAILWACSGTAGKALFDAGISPFELVQIRVTLASAFLGPALFILSRRLLAIRLRDMGYFVLLGGVGMSLVQFTYLYTISKIQVAAAILLQYLAPMFVSLFAMCFWKERLTLFKVAALLLAFGGCYLVVGGYNLRLLQMNRLGVMGGIAGAVCFAAYTLLGERGMHRYRPWTVLFYALAFAAIAWHIFYPPFHYLHAGFTPKQWGLIVYIAVFGTIIPFGLYFVGVNFIRSTRAVVTATLEPVCAGVVAFLALGETLQSLQLLGEALVIGAIVLLQVQKERDEMAPAVIRSRRVTQ